MKFYNQSDLFWVLISAARDAQLRPDSTLLRQYKESRIRKAIKAVRTKNIFLFTEGTRTSVNLNDITTIYTQPAGVRLMVVGYSDNLRYGGTMQPDAALAASKVIFPQMHRVRVIGNAGKALCEDLCPAQAGVSGQPRYTSTLLPAPFILEANEQIAVDLGYDTAMSAPAVIPAQAFIFFCVKIKDQLTSEDLNAIEDIKIYVANHNYQRGIFLNCFTLAGTSATDDIEFSTAIAGGVASCDTRPANRPLLITGVGTTLLASTILITDTYDGHSFSLNRAMRSSALNMVDNSDVTGSIEAGVPDGAPIWASYFEFPSPHLLRSGAQLHCDVVNGGTDAIGTARLDTQTGNVIIFQGLTV